MYGTLFVPLIELIRKNCGMCVVFTEKNDKIGIALCKAKSKKVKYLYIYRHIFHQYFGSH